MNLANKVTIMRVIMIPVFIFIFISKCFGELTDIISLSIFVFISITDFIDGYIARKYNMVTNFGKFVDPLADKLLVASALICLLEYGRISGLVVVIIIAREFIISGFRLIAVDNGVVLAASNIAKYKTTFHILMICVLILNLENEVYIFLSNILIGVSLLLTIISLVDYIYKNREILIDTDF